ncbi:autotransporter domain-containing protein [Aureimonas pseudogalii]|uniref:Outer membrane autotransporter protein n=1 Tax=Aureimonas pseudogalii TaxID=1744844 RepID=A0A7W6MMJ2_9HYPH|nr:autotransporter domain-containing protein [Aureimonas pseudogalii]MBB4000888.1 outer membrane autotransporter protein [Aureimonas pseudogalii]
MSTAKAAWLAGVSALVLAAWTGTASAQSVTITGEVDPGSAVSPTWAISQYLAIGLNGSGTVTVAAGGTVSNTYGFIGRVAGSTGTATVTVTGTGSTWSNGGYLFVGESGNGTLTVAAGGSVSNAFGYIGLYAGSTGTATVTGAGSTWTNDGNLSVGNEGSGTLTVEAGGAVFAGGASGAGGVWVARNAGSTGTVIVGAAAGQTPVSAGRIAAAELAFGAGTGTLVFNHTGNPHGSPVVFAPLITGAGTINHLAGTTVFNGANTYTGVTTISGGILRVGHGAALGGTSAGTTVANGAALEVTGGLTLIEPLIEPLTLSGGGVADGGALRNLSDNNTVSGPITLAGANTRINSDAGLLTLSGGISGLAGANRDLVLGGAGNGAVSGTMGGNLRTFLKDGAGTWSLTGVNTFAGEAIVNGGALTVEAGGTLGSGEGFIARDSGSTGTATVTGAGSTWTNGQLSVGDGGSGSLTVAAGGAVSNTSGFLGYFAGSTGTATVTGAGSTWTNSGALDVGLGGSGTLTVETGGSVSSVFGYIGLYAGSTGTATVTGVGSTWTNRGSLEVGYEGSGTLTVAAGGAVVEGTTAGPGTVAVARNAGSAGTVNIGAAAGQPAVSAGRIAAGRLAFGTGTGTLVFNHSGNPDGSAAVFAPVITGAGTIDHLAGRTVFSGTNTAPASFTGTTSVTGGTLSVNGVLGDLNGTGGLNQAQVTVSGSGTLGGTGTIAGSVAVSSGGTLSAGNSPGTLTVNGNVALGSGSTALFELGTPGVVGGTDNDLVRVGGNLAIDTGSTLVLRNSAHANAAATSGIYTLFDVAGTTSGTFGTVTNGGAIATADVRQAATNPGGAPSRFDILLANGGQVVQVFDGTDQTADGTVDGGTFNNAWRSQVGVFSGAPGTVSVSGTQSFEGLQFTVGGYDVTGGSLNLAGNATGSNGRSFVTVDTGTTTIASTLIGTGGLFKQGGGTLVLSAANSYTGGTDLARGTLAIGADASLGAASSGLIFSGGTLRTTGSFASARDVAITSSGTISTDTGVATTLSGVISGAGSLTATGTGTLILTGANTHQGGTRIAGGGLTLATGGSLASGVTNAGIFTNDGTVSGAVANSGTTSNTGAVTGDVTNSSVFAQSGSIGGSVANTGTFTQSAGSIGGNVTNGAAFTLSGGTIGGSIANTGAFTSTGTVTASGGVSNTGTGTLTVTGGSLSSLASLTNASSAPVGVSVASGASLATNALAGTNASSVTEVNGTLSFADAPYAGLFTGAGRIEQTGGTFTAAASNTSTQSFTGVYDLGGTMIVSGTFGDLGQAGGLNGAQVNVNAGGRLGGTGTIAGSVFTSGGTLGGGLRVAGDTTLGAGSILKGSPIIGGNLVVGSGAVVSPGNSPGTVTVNGNVAFAAGSTYLVETVPGSGLSDLIAVGGTATLNGAQVRHIGLDGAYLPTQTYTILTAQGGVSGQFASATSDYLFLSPTLGYAANAVTLRLDRNDTRFASVATTANQRAAATGLEGLGFANAAFAAASVLDAPNARVAFDQLSGEVHASQKTGRLEDVRFLRNTAMERLDAAFTVLDEQGSDPVEGSVVLASTGIEAWISGYGSWGETDGNGNAASLDRDIGGFLVGADGFLTETLRIGVMAGYSEASYDVDARGSSADVDSTHVSLYAGTMLGAVELKAGASYSFDEIHTSRQIAFGTFRDQLTASYDGGTAQVFGEASYRVDLGFGTSISPFANLAYVSLDTDGFNERGGSATLRSSDDTTETTFSTLGLKGQATMPIGGLAVNATGMLGWRHAFDDRTPTDTIALIAGGPAFTVSGVPIAEDAAIVELGLGIDVAPNATLGLHYAGQFANDATDNGVRATFEVKF